MSELWPGTLTSSPSHHSHNPLAERALAHRFQRPADLVLGPLLGTGSHASVYKARWHGTVVAAKVVLHAKNDRHSAVDAQHVQCLLAANHPNVVACYRVWTEEVGPMGEALAADEGSVGEHGAVAAQQPRESGLLQTTLLLEYCDRGTLRRAVRGGRLWRAEEAEGTRTPDLVRTMPTYTRPIHAIICPAKDPDVCDGHCERLGLSARAVDRPRGPAL